jgi:uncharacterized membrane protein
VGGAIGTVTAFMMLGDVTAPPGVLKVALTVLAVVVAWSSVVYWRNLDEAAREAHKFAWLWGGTGGALAVVLLANFMTPDRLQAVFGPQSISTWLILGMFAMILAQIVGYLLVWAGWWLARQR